jgi:hypothetical protein
MSDNNQKILDKMIELRDSIIGHSRAVEILKDNVAHKNYGRTDMKKLIAFAMADNISRAEEKHKEISELLEEIEANSDEANEEDELPGDARLVESEVNDYINEMKDWKEWAEEKMKRW